MIRVGIDVGSLFIKIYGTIEGKLIKHYSSHEGEYLNIIEKKILPHFKKDGSFVSVTGRYALSVSSKFGFSQVDYVTALIRSVLSFYPEARQIMDIGGGSVSLIYLDEEGRFKSYVTNSICAAGTGSFLDEQMRRLGLNYENIKEFSIIKDPPHIAARCAVFAKTDIVHFQQEGYTKEDLWSGLSRGMVTTIFQTLLKGKTLSGLTVVTGGVTLNKSVMYWLNRLLRTPIKSFELAPLSGAHGAFIVGEKKENTNFMNFSETKTQVIFCNFQKNKRRPPLQLNITFFPDERPLLNYITQEGTEVRIHCNLEGVIPVFLGIDIGSTSTKAVLIDVNDRIIIDLYRKTLGEPVESTKKLFKAILDIEKKNNVKFKVLGCGTTGSGRKIVGKLTGADVIKNEITAHVKGALKIDSGIDTIFEIGGQDSKYIRTENGNIVDSNLNYVCAAGTGSFVEEQAEKLGFSINEVGDIVLGISPPLTSDRCTVFMEQDVLHLLQKGYDRKEVMAAVCYSVIENYLNRVVGKRYISPKRILFLGATARNKGLVAAIENLLNVEVVVSPFSHVMGAYGVALLSRELKNRKTRFRGFELAYKRINLSEGRCEICNNRCRINYLEIEGEDEKPSFGYMCGREPDEKRVKNLDKISLYHKREKFLHLNYFKNNTTNRGKRIGIPMALSTYSYLPFFKTLFMSLGFEVILTGKTDPLKKEKAFDIVGSEYCCPVKFAHGHIFELLQREDVDYVFYPLFVSDKRDYSNFPNYFFCPLNIGLPAMIKNSIGNELERKLLSPVIDNRYSLKINVKNLVEVFGSKLKIDEKKIKLSLVEAYKAQEEFSYKLKEEGKKALKELREKDEIGIVILGRPYNIFDTGINLSIPLKIANLGFKVIPMDFIPFEGINIEGVLHHMYWKYGQDILRTLYFIKNEKNLFPLYLSNFNCGPDSFLLTYCDEIFKEKPFLTLELDEHRADAGYITRIEAFADVIENYISSGKKVYLTEGSKICNGGVPLSLIIRKPPENPGNFRKRIIWIPHMHIYGTPLFAAAFRAFGYEAKPIPPEDLNDFELGRKLSRGSECLPAILTIGSFINAVKKYGYERGKHALFMATATGPCRFGQYRNLHRIILNRIRWDDIPIMSPSSSNTYSGLPNDLRRYLWKIILTADILFKIGCKLRPYEKRRGEVNEFLDFAMKELIKVVEKRGDVEKTLSRIAEDAIKIDISKKKKPLVGIVGEIYIRSNAFSNQSVVDVIERNGAEAWPTPLSEWFLYTSFMESWNKKKEGKNFIEKVRISLKNQFLKGVESRFYNLVSPILQDRIEPEIDEILKTAKKYSLHEFQGEATLTVGRTILFLEEGASLVVNCSPFGCMPGSLSSGVLNFIQEKFNRPVVNMFYDGEVYINDILDVYLRNL